MKVVNPREPKLRMILTDGGFSHQRLAVLFWHLKASSGLIFLMGWRIGTKYEGSLTVNGPDMKKGNLVQVSGCLRATTFHYSAAYFMTERPTQQVVCRQLVGELEGLSGRPVKGNGCAVTWSWDSAGILSVEPWGLSWHFCQEWL